MNISGHVALLESAPYWVHCRDMTKGHWELVGQNVQIRFVMQAGGRFAINNDWEVAINVPKEKRNLKAQGGYPLVALEREEFLTFRVDVKLPNI